MLDLKALKSRLPAGSLGEPLHYFESTGSTNDIAIELASQGAPAGTLVLADEQTAGRGRLDRSWSTPQGAALAFSLLVRPGTPPADRLMSLNSLGALAVAEALEGLGLAAKIKWPNDVLLADRKVAGVLVESGWRGEELDYVVLGIGVNVKEGSAPPDEAVRWPATSVEAALGSRVDRLNLLVGVLESLDGWLGRFGTKDLQTAWERRLAYLGEAVELHGRQATLEGTLLGLSADGRLRLRDQAGVERIVGQEYMSLRPLDRDGT